MALTSKRITLWAFQSIVSDVLNGTFAKIKKKRKKKRKKEPSTWDRSAVRHWWLVGPRESVCDARAAWKYVLAEFGQNVSYVTSRRVCARPPLNVFFFILTFPLQLRFSRFTPSRYFGASRTGTYMSTCAWHTALSKTWQRWKSPIL